MSPAVKPAPETADAPAPSKCSATRSLSGLVRKDQHQARESSPLIQLSAVSLQWDKRPFRTCFGK